MEGKREERGREAGETEGGDGGKDEGKVGVEEEREGRETSRGR